MEKGPFIEAAALHPRNPRQRHGMLSRLPLPLTFVACCLTSYTLCFGLPFSRPGAEHHDPQQDTSEAFSWSTIPSKSHLEYVRCYEGFYCARLELPMDYWNATTSATVSIAVIKKPAPVPVTHAQYGGAVLHNPGGPGGSGVGFLLRAGEGLQEVVGDPDGLMFDHISFDPRGIAFSTPNVECFKDPSYQNFWLARVFEEGLPSSSDAAFGRLWSMSIAQAGSCSLPPEDGGVDVKRYVNTAYVARDMLEIVERHGEWREAYARRFLDFVETGVGRKAAGDELSSDAMEIIEKVKYRKGEEKINYWGFSYGSYLGNTFAAMFPDRVNRLIVDGVVDANDYRKALWLDNLMDTDKDLNLLYYHCARVGYPKCALANETGETTAKGVETRVNNLLATLLHNPLPIISYEQPSIFSYSDVKGLLFAALYSPMTLFQPVAAFLADIEQAAANFTDTLNPTGLSAQLGPVGTSPRNHNEEEIKAVGQAAQMAIACSDGDDQTHTTKEQFRKHISALEKESPALGEIWASLRLSCIHYTLRSPYRFTADWTANTSYPILEIGNTADPVTPGRYAKKMAKGFVGARALIQDGPGHCSLAARSECTRGYVRGYFQRGELPEEGTVCGVDEVPFGDGEESVEIKEGKRWRRLYGDMSGALLDSMGEFGGVGRGWL